MEYIITEKQLKLILSNKIKNQEIGEQSEPSTAGTSSTQSGGQGYPSVGKWESGLTRGPANQIGVTKWSDIVGSTLKRGKANPLKEGNEFADMMRGADLKKVEKDNESFKQMMNNHDFLQVSALVTDFIPFVGPFISAGLIARDIQLYKQEGKEKEAASTLVWSIIPGLQIAKTLGLTKLLGLNQLKNLGTKLLSGTKLFSPSEVEAVKIISKNKKLIQNELAKKAELTIAQAKNKVKSKQNLKSKLLKTGGTLVTTGLLAHGAGERALAKQREEEEAGLAKLDSIVSAKKNNKQLQQINQKK
jgi:hypothetical protein